jgi:hypothetical protein
MGEIIAHLFRYIPNSTSYTLFESQFLFTVKVAAEIFAANSEFCGLELGRLATVRIGLAA